MRGVFAKLSMAKIKNCQQFGMRWVHVPKVVIRFNSMAEYLCGFFLCISKCVFVCVRAPAQLLQPWGCGKDCEQYLPKVFIINCVEYLITNLHRKGNSL